MKEGRRCDTIANEIMDHADPIIEKHEATLEEIVMGLASTIGSYAYTGEIDLEKVIQELRDSFEATRQTSEWLKRAAAKGKS